MQGRLSPKYEGLSTIRWTLVLCLERSGGARGECLAYVEDVTAEVSVDADLL